MYDALTALPDSLRLQAQLMSKPETPDLLPLGATDFHVLLVLSRGALYGYAIMKAVEEESGGRISPEIGSLYRVLSRLLAAGLVEETGVPAGVEKTHPGRDRKYYRLTAGGRAAARAEAARLHEVLELARARKLLPGGHTP